MKESRNHLFPRCARWTLTLVLLYHVFYEVGIATWLAIALLALNGELQLFINLHFIEKLYERKGI